MDTLVPNGVLAVKELVLEAVPEVVLSIVEDVADVMMPVVMVRIHVVYGTTVALVLEVAITVLIAATVLVVASVLMIVRINAEVAKVTVPTVVLVPPNARMDFIMNSKSTCPIGGGGDSLHIIL